MYDFCELLLLFSFFQIVSTSEHLITHKMKDIRKNSAYANDDINYFWGQLTSKKTNIAVSSLIIVHRLLSLVSQEITFPRSWLVRFRKLSNKYRPPKS